MDSAQLVPVEATIFGLRFQSIDPIRIRSVAATLFALFALGYIARVASDVVAWFDGHFEGLQASKQDEVLRELYSQPVNEFEETENEIVEGETEMKASAELLFDLRSPHVVPLVTLVEIVAPYAASLFVTWSLFRR